MKGLSPKRIILKPICCRTGKYTAGRLVTAFFSPETLQSGAVKKSSCQRFNVIQNSTHVFRHEADGGSVRRLESSSVPLTAVM